MYLLVFVTLVIGLISIYGQILVVQAERIAASMTGLATAMTVWHGAAVSMAGSIIGTGRAYGVRCSLTFMSPAGVARCPTPSGWTAPAGWAAPPVGIVTNGAATPVFNNIVDYKRTPAINVPVSLPQGYAADRYQFSSVLYNDAGQPYVVTFVQPPALSAANPAPGLIQLPLPPPRSNDLTRYTIVDLINQFKQLNLTSASWGTAYGDQLFTGAYNDGSTTGRYTYTLPAGLLLNNSVAIISSPIGF